MGTILTDVDYFFGNWIENVDKLRKIFSNAKPYEHIVIDNFLQGDFAEQIYKEFPNDFTNWHKYNNPLEVKYAFDHLEKMGENTQKLFSLFASEQFTNIISNISNIHNIEPDPYLHGAGLHAHPRNGRLNVHLDYEQHPILKNKERRLNIILFITKDWKEEWHGDNQLWDTNLIDKVHTQIKFNRAIIFKTNDISWHGLPDKITCPEGVYRKSIAYYYISDLVSKAYDNKYGNDGSGHRTKATYIQVPNEPYNDKIQQLIKIRPFRRIEKEDMEQIWAEWTPEEF